MRCLFHYESNSSLHDILGVGSRENRVLWEGEFTVAPLHRRRLLSLLQQAYQARKKKKNSPEGLGPPQSQGIPTPPKEQLAATLEQRPMPSLLLNILF